MSRPKSDHAPSASSEPDQLSPDEAGAIRIGATDEGMVRLIVTTRSETVDLDFDPEDAREIAAEILAAADLCENASDAKMGAKSGKSGGRSR